MWKGHWSEASKPTWEQGTLNSIHSFRVSSQWSQLQLRTLLLVSSLKSPTPGIATSIDSLQLQIKLIFEDVEVTHPLIYHTTVKQSINLNTLLIETWHPYCQTSRNIRSKQSSLCQPPSQLFPVGTLSQFLVQAEFTFTNHDQHFKQAVSTTVCCAHSLP